LTLHDAGRKSETATLVAGVIAGPTFNTVVPVALIAAPVRIVYQADEATLYASMVGVIDPEVNALTLTMICPYGRGG
jgi:hypothetical protein